MRLFIKLFGNSLFGQSFFSIDYICSVFSNPSLYQFIKPRFLRLISLLEFLEFLFKVQFLQPLIQMHTSLFPFLGPVFLWSLCFINLFYIELIMLTWRPSNKNVLKGSCYCLCLCDFFFSVIVKFITASRIKAECTWVNILK